MRMKDQTSASCHSNSGDGLQLPRRVQPLETCASELKTHLTAPDTAQCSASAPYRQKLHSSSFFNFQCFPVSGCDDDQVWECVCSASVRILLAVLQRRMLLPTCSSMPKSRHHRLLASTGDALVRAIKDHIACLCCCSTPVSTLAACTFNEQTFCPVLPLRFGV